MARREFLPLSSLIQRHDRVRRRDRRDRREGNERDAGEQQQRRMNARLPAEIRSLPKSERGDCDRA